VRRETQGYAGQKTTEATVKQLIAAGR